MELKELQRNWDILGKEDPLWAIISFEDKKGNKWDVTEFFASGEQEITALMQYVSSLNLIGPRRRALDFGCGVGRLTRPLARYFSKVTGIDIAPSMIAQAQALDREARCEFILNDRADLSIFPANEFDFIYSNIVLQHMRPEYSTAYIREFCRVLAPGGVAVFQLPSKSKPPATQWSWRDSVRPFIPPPLLHWYRYLYRGRRLVTPAPAERAHTEMYTVPKSEVLDLIAKNGCPLVDAVENMSCGPAYESWRYCMVKR
jgi:ubiquinone/menaquinone biosynthesis C-methylase UbiE